MFQIKENIKDEIIVKKSKFITFAFNIKNIDNINNILNNLKEEYKDSSHICYAYKLGNLKKAYDDNEPNHTAGMPILNIIDKNELDNILIVVVRYFGGIKLGASNLLRTYLTAAKNVIDKATLIPIKKEYKIKIEFLYKDVNNINYILKDYKITYKEFDNNIIYEFIYEEDKYPKELDNYIIKKQML